MLEIRFVGFRAVSAVAQAPCAGDNAVLLRRATKATC